MSQDKIRKPKPKTGGKVPSFFFDGLPAGGTVAIATTGIHDRESLRIFAEGWRRLVNLTTPETILVYGALPAGFNGYALGGGVAVKEYPTFTARNRARLDKEA